MKHIYPDFVYGDGPRAGCWWDATCDLPEFVDLDQDLHCDVAIIGGGFTGLNAALELAARGRDVVVLDSQYPGWGASGRNGGFCCLGGGKLGDSALDARFGVAARREWRRTEIDAIDHVAGFLKRSGAEVDRHSDGETWLAHRARDMQGIDRIAARTEENYGVAPRILMHDDLAAHGLKAGRTGAFHGALEVPIGFALNPRKYIAALVMAAKDAGVRIFSRCPASDLSFEKGRWKIQVRGQTVEAQSVVVATNGYSSEDTPRWLRGRYMPMQSSVTVSRPLTDAELEAQGWTSQQMCWDSRNLLHYFRLMPDKRMLFGMRGGLMGTATSEARAKRRTSRDFRRMFPAWSHVELTHHWSGMVCMSRGFMPMVGQAPGASGLWYAMCYHGNGVSMGSYSGHLVANAICGDDLRPAVMKSAPNRFPLGSVRRALTWPAYAGYMLRDL